VAKEYDLIAAAAVITSDADQFGLKR